MNPKMIDPAFRFDSYSVRPMGEQDRLYLDSLIESDAYHKGRMTPDYFLNLVPGEDAWAIEDEHGCVVLYFKTQTAVRLSLIFADATTDVERHRNRDAMLRGLAWLEAMLRMNKFREILFDTQGPELRSMAKRRMGFRETNGDLTREITPPKPQTVAMEPWGASPHALQREG
jgi:hypothetical protein